MCRPGKHSVFADAAFFTVLVWIAVAVIVTQVEANPMLTSLTARAVAIAVTFVAAHAAVAVFRLAAEAILRTITVIPALAADF